MNYRIGYNAGSCTSTAGNCTACVCGDGGYGTSTSTLTVKVTYVTGTDTSTPDTGDDDGSAGVREPAK